MKGKTRLLMVLAAFSPLCVQAQGIADIISALADMSAFRTEARYAVTLPSKDDDVVYTLRMAEEPAPADTLCPSIYHIAWSLPTPSGDATGWSAYFDGNLYLYRADRLREYHTSWDPAPFRSQISGSRTIDGVQLSTQFADLLPSFLARQLRSMQADSTWTLTAPRQVICDGRDAVRFDAKLDIAGERVQEKSYWFDAATGRPLRIDLEANPGSITEQTITTTYTYPDSLASTPIPVSEENLIALYPETFERFRESNFRIENLADTPMPAFSLPTSTGERYTRHRGDPFRTTTVIALLDPSTSFSPNVVADLRKAYSGAANDFDIVWAVTGTNADAAEALVPQLQPGEHLLLNARSLARDCGASSLPVVLVVDARGVVKKVILGYNPELATIVIQSVALAQ